MEDEEEIRRIIFPEDYHVRPDYIPIGRREQTEEEIRKLLFRDVAETLRKITEEDRRREIEENSKRLRKIAKENRRIEVEEKRKRQKLTFPEQLFQEICEKYNLPFQYVGNRKFWIGDEIERLNPDFIYTMDKRILVEVFGDYWHSPLLNPKLPQSANLNYRKNHYKRYKWIPIFIWETDLKREDAEQFVLKLLSHFL